MTLGAKNIWKLTKTDKLFYIKLFISSFLTAFLVVVAVLGLENVSGIWNAMPIALIVAIVVATVMNILYVRKK